MCICFYVWLRGPPPHKDCRGSSMGADVVIGAYNPRGLARTVKFQLLYFMSIMSAYDSVTGPLCLRRANESTGVSF